MRMYFGFFPTPPLPHSPTPLLLHFPTPPLPYSPTPLLPYSPTPLGGLGFLVVAIAKTPTTLIPA
ncbi:hypothetical protein, partial [Okeania sp. SIO3B5]|uniref:hypothetical protein n=1 Tax=Okeania sp. SIO3B5 TaxID=2607811 RepID=UPI0025D7ABD3